MDTEIKVSGKTWEELKEVAQIFKKTIDMKTFTLIMSGVVKSHSSSSDLSAPIITILGKSAEEVSFSIIRTDSRGVAFLWEVSINESMSVAVDWLDQSSGTVLESGAVSLISNGNPISSFYLRVRDTNSPTYNDGIAAIQYIEIEISVPLEEPVFTLTPLVDSVLISLSSIPSATRYILDQSTDGLNWVEVTDNYPIGSQPYEVTGLSEETVYYFRITATSDNLLFEDSFSIQETETLNTPILPTPVDLIFEDLGSGVVRIETVYSGVSGVTYVVERNGVEVYSGLSATFDLPGFVDDSSYVIRAKVQLAGYDDSDWYSETYTHQDVPVDYLTIEQFGGNGYYKRFDKWLNYTSLGNGTTRITYTGFDNVFSSDDAGKRFCGLYAHKNPATPNTSNINEYYPNIEGSRYCNVVSVIDGKNIIVDFQFNLNRSNWPGYVFFDNSKAFSDMIDSLFSGDKNEVRLTAEKTYVVPEFTYKTTPTKEIKFWTGTGFSANIKLGYEDYYKWGPPNAVRLVKQSGIMFGLTISNHNFISHNINWIPPHRRIPEADPFAISFFGGDFVGLQNRIVAIINSNGLFEQEEIGELNTYGNFATNSFGTAYAGGSYSGSGILEDTTGYLYLLLKGVKHQGNTFTQIKANNGGGAYEVFEDVECSNSDSDGFNPWYFEGTVKLSTDYSGLPSEIGSRNYYPSHLLELTSDNSWFQIGNFFTNEGWGNVGNVIQIGGFVFWQPVGNYWKFLYEAWYSRGNTKRSWFVSASGSDNFNSRKMMMHHIPRSGQRYTIGRSYTLGSGKTIASYRKSRVRGNVNWCAVLNKRWDQINPVSEIPANSFPLEFQPGDRFTIVGQGSTVYTVIRTDRLSESGTNWGEEPRLWGRISDEALVYYASEYYLDKDIPDSLGLSFEIDVIESKAEILLDGVERPMYAAYKANLDLRAGDIFLPGYVVKNHDINTDMTDGNIIASDPLGHATYDHAEVTMWAKNYVKRGDTRQSNNSYPTPYTVPNPTTGQNIITGPLRKYSKGYTLINCSGFVRQFNPVAQFEIRDLIRKSQGINLAESAKEKLRMYNCTDMNGLEAQSGPYLENYPNTSGAPDMPAPCRQLLDSLPN